MASAWFDYLDIRINGAAYHRELLAAKHRFDDPQVRRVFDRWREVLPYFDPNGAAGAFQDATTALLNGRSGMMLIGTFFADVVMPRMGGCELTWVLSGTHPGIPVILISGLLAADHLDHDVRPAAYLQKPLSGVEIVTAVAAVLA